MYNTMDTFGALMFGMLIIDVLKQKDYRQLATDSLSGACWADLGGRAGICLHLLVPVGHYFGGLLDAPNNGG